MNRKYDFYFDPQRCLKCWACEIACQQWHGIKAATIKFRVVSEIVRGTFPNVDREFQSLACRHCTEAPCITACPVGAIQKRDDGIVVVDKSLCTGCRVCLEDCPYHIPQFGDDGTMLKCDMCLDRLAQGRQPICAEACPTRALQWGTTEELARLTHPENQS